MFVSRKHKLRRLNNNSHPSGCLLSVFWSLTNWLEPGWLAGWLGRKFSLKLEHFRPSLAEICKRQLGLSFTATILWPGLACQLSGNISAWGFPHTFLGCQEQHQRRQRKRAGNCEFTFWILNQEIQNWLYFIKLSFLVTGWRREQLSNCPSLFPIIIVFTPYKLRCWLGNRKTELFVFIKEPSKHSLGRPPVHLKTPCWEFRLDPQLDAPGFLVAAIKTLKRILQTNRKIYFHLIWTQIIVWVYREA